MASDEEVEEVELTSVNPLNVALKAKSTTAKVCWWLIAAIDFVVLTYFMSSLILKYEDHQINAKIHLKKNQIPFPAVTFCNMNPYKRSALEKIPDLENLLNQFQQMTNSNSNDSDDSSKKRKKRQTAEFCDCVEGNLIAETNLSDSSQVLHTYKLISNPFGETYACAWKCCAKHAPDISYSCRLAKIDTKLLFGLLRDKKVISNTVTWIGMASLGTDGTYMPTSYKWYNNPNGSAGNDITVREIEKFCGSCKIFDSVTWARGGSATIRLSDADTIEFNNHVVFMRVEAQICEYVYPADPNIYCDPPTTPTMSASSISTRTQQTNTDGLTKISSEKMTTKNTAVETAPQITLSIKLDKTTPREYSMTAVSEITSKATRRSTSPIAAGTTPLTPVASANDKTSGQQNDQVTSISEKGDVQDPKLTEQTPITILVQVALNKVKTDFNSLSATAQDMLPYLLATLPPSVLIEAGYKATEVIMRCVYNGVRCSVSDFKLKLDPNYGNCYTFNVDGSFGVGARAGALTGLSVTYNVGENQHLDFSQMAGVRVVVHKQNTTVFPDVMGFNVPSRYQSSIAMTRIEINSLSQASKHCADSIKDVPTYYYKEAFYSTEACLRSCYQKEVVARCKCGDPRVPLPTQVGFCRLEKRDCVNSNYDVNLNSSCSCPLGCQFVDYEITQTLGRWPTLDRNLQRSNINGTSSNDKSQLAKIDVFYKQLVITEYEEAWQYAWDQLMWDLSSLIGLTLGVSVISLFEVIKLGEWCRKKCQSSNWQR